MASRVFPTIFSRRLQTVLWVLFVVPTLLYGQARSAITGSVVDEHNRPLPNVNLFFKQAKRGTVTNSDGQFQLRLPETRDTLTASCIGYETQDIPVAQNRVTLSIRLVPADVPLNEVIVTNLSARELLQKAIEKIPQNYPQTEFLTNIFYRAKINDPATDSLLYAEEAAIEQIKSYRRKAK
uniref:carboxypeptidase-like regulatory domain-containing protein n=1 Tax=Prevotella heparinolytica TaxID=28113 RepID=UPI0035A1110C